MCKLRQELPPVNLAAVTCHSWSGMTGKLVPGSIIVCSMGSSTARGAKITGVCRSPPLPEGVGRRQLAALSGLPDSSARRQIFFGSCCNTVVCDYAKMTISIQSVCFWMKSVTNNNAPCAARDILCSSANYIGLWDIQPCGLSVYCDLQCLL